MGQEALNDSVGKKDPVAVVEFGAAYSLDVRNGGSSFGYSVAVEVTPIEDWLELELGVTPTFGLHLKERDMDLLFKKPWTFSPKVEFMFGVGLAWTHTNDDGVITNAASGEIALDFMFWPSFRHRFGWYPEPAYEFGLGGEHDRSVGMSGGLLVSIP